MNNISRISLFAACVCLQGCQAMMYGTAKKLNNVKVGMTRAQVIEQLGEPISTSAPSAREEVLRYRWMKQVVALLPTFYFVRLIDGTVSAYGEERELEGVRMASPVASPTKVTGQ